MKGIPVQLQGVINFINTIIQNKTLSQTFQCYLLNLQKATLDTLKVANIAFENLDNHVPFDVRMMFQKTTSKIKEFIKNKPKGQLEKQQKYYHEYDQVQDYLQNRPEIQRSNAEERGQLYKFLNQVEEKQRQNKLLLENIPKYSYGATRNYTKQHKTYFSDFNMNDSSLPNTGRNRGSQLFCHSFKEQVGFEGFKNKDKIKIEKHKCINEMIQTDLTLNLLNQLTSNIDCKKISGQLQHILFKQITTQKQHESQAKNNILASKNQQENQSHLDGLVPQNSGEFRQGNKKLTSYLSKKNSMREQNIVEASIQQENMQTEAKIKQQLTHIQGFQLQKVEVKNQQVMVKGFIKNKANQKKQPKSKKNGNIRKDSIFNKKNKNIEEIQTSRQKNINEPRQSTDKTEKILQKLNKTKNKQNFLGSRYSKNYLKPSVVSPNSVSSSVVPSSECKVQKYTQTDDNLHEMQMNKPESADIVMSNKDVTSTIFENKQKSSSLQKVNTKSEKVKQSQKKSRQTKKAAADSKTNSNKQQPIKDEQLETKINQTMQQKDKDGNLVKSKITQNIKQQDLNENAQGDGLNTFYKINGQPESALPYLDNTYNTHKPKCQIFTNSIPNLTLTSFKEKGELNNLKKTKSNFSQFHQSMHMNSSQYKLQKHNIQSLHKKELQRSLQNLPAIRQEQQNQIYKKREKVLSKGKAEILERQNKRLLDQIQEGTSQKKGKNVEWTKVIRDIREYEHLHFKYCGENCVHLNKFYEFLKKKNLSMYINRKQLYVHKQNLQMKPPLI